MQQQSCNEVRQVKGFANMVSHAGFQAGVPVRAHGIGRHGNDGQVRQLQF